MSQWICRLLSIKRSVDKRLTRVARQQSKRLKIQHYRHAQIKTIQNCSFNESKKKRSFISWKTSIWDTRNFGKPWSCLCDWNWKWEECSSSNDSTKIETWKVGTRTLLSHIVHNLVLDMFVFMRTFTVFRMFLGKNKVMQVALGTEFQNEAAENIHQIAKVGLECDWIVPNTPWLKCVGHRDTARMAPYTLLLCVQFL